jgi:hypothetical protein
MAVPPRIDARLERLEQLLGRLEGFRARGRAAYQEDPDVSLDDLRGFASYVIDRLA